MTDTAPKSAVDATAQAFADKARDDAARATALAEAETQRAEDIAAKAAEYPEAPPPGEPSLAEKERASVVAVSGPRNVNMVMSEDERLAAHKAAVRAHLDTAELDMTGGTGVAPAPAEEPVAPPPEQPAQV